MIGYHMEFTPIFPQNKRQRTYQRLKNETSIISRDGCHRCPHCEDCPKPDCVWDYEEERQFAKRRNGGNNKWQK